MKANFSQLLPWSLLSAVVFLNANRAQGAVSLNEALDTPGLVWTTVGSPPWEGQTLVSHDGFGAAQTGVAADSTAVTIQTIVTGPGTISYWWKVSSESNNDFLKFFISGVQQTRISGEVDWQSQSFPIAAGPQTLKWTYSKSASGASGLDRGWVDQVQFTPGTNAVCSYVISPFNNSHSSLASTGFANVTTSAGCGWSAVNTNPWIVIVSGATGAGNGTIAYALAENPSPFSRSGAVNIGGQNLIINQAGIPCSLTLSQNSIEYSAAAGIGNLAVFTTAECPWTAASSSPWVTITSSTNGVGSGTVSYSVAANPNAPRSGSITIGSQVFTINQDGLPCTFSLSPASNMHGSGVETGFVAMTTVTGCPWSVINTNPWVTILTGGNTSSGMVAYKVSANLKEEPRTGYLNIAGQNFEIAQSAGTPLSPVAIGPVPVNSLGHSFRYLKLPDQSMFLIPPTATDYFIDQQQSTGGGGVLPSVSVNWDVNTRFSVTVTAPPGKKFMVRVPAGRAAAFGGFLLWESTRGGFSGAGASQVTFGDLEGQAPDFSGATSVLSDSHGFWGFEDLEGGAFTNNLAFTSITLAADILPQFTGNGAENYSPHHQCSLLVSYSMTETNDPGRFVSLVPIDEPLSGAPSVSVSRQPNGDVKLSFTGILQVATSIDGTFEDVAGNPESTYTIPKEGLVAQRYFRTKRNSP